MKELLILSEVRKVYNGAAALTALSEITVQILAGEFVAVMGPSGSGKSTLLNVIAGLDRPTSGSIVVDGLQISRLGEAALARYRRDHLGFVFQSFHLLNNLTVLENVLIPAQLTGVRDREGRARANSLLEQLGISDKAGQFPAKLSGGQRQRVAIARALINRPALLLADEPTGALDSKAGDEVMELLAGLHREGQTIILVTHDAKLATRYARRVLALRDGRIVDDTQLESGPLPATRDLLRVRRQERGQ